MSAPVILLLLLVVMFAWIMFLFGRSQREVVNLFRDNNAVDAKSALTREELGVTPQSAVERLYKVPDYKPYALQFFLSRGIVKTKGKEKLYLSEEDFSSYYKNSIMKLFLPAPRDGV